MFKLKRIAVALGFICSAQYALAAEFAQGMSPATSALQEAAQQEMAAAPAQPTAQTAGEMAQAFLDRQGQSTGLVPVKREDGKEEILCIAVGTYTHPATAQTISTIRNVGTMTAILNAKADIAKTLASKVSADIASLMPENTGLGTEYDQKKEELENEIEALLAEYQQAAAEAERAESGQVGGLNPEDALAEGVSAILSKFDVKVDAAKLKQENAQKIQALKERAEQLDQKRAQLNKMLQDLQGQLNSEERSTVQVLANAVLTGAVVVNSYESLIDGQYEVSVILSWSSPQERFIRALTQNQPVSPDAFKPTTKKNLNEYVISTKWERVAGGRWIVANDGTPHLFAVGTAELRDNNANAKRKAAALAQTNAMGNLAMSLYSDVTANQQARAIVQNINDGKGGEIAQTAEEIAQRLQASVQNLVVQGANKVREVVAVSPLTGRKTQICVYEFSPAANKVAKEQFNRQRDTAVEMGKAQQQLRGYVDETKRIIEQADKDASAYAAGQAATQRSAAQAAAQQSAAPQAASGAPAAAANPNAPLLNSSFGGEGEEDFQF